MSHNERTRDQPKPGRGPSSGRAESPLSLRQLAGLVRLLGDETEQIHGMACERLTEERHRARPLLTTAVRDHDNPVVAREAATLLTRWARQDCLEEWAAFVDRDELDLEKGAFLIARVEYPQMKLSAHRKRLDEMASVLAARMPASREPDTVVQKLVKLLFKELRFRGNREDYFDPENSFLNRVIDRRLGIPISLSVLCILVARRVGLELEGVGLPRHFIVRARHGGKEIYFDPFNGGRSWSLEDCLEYLRAEGYRLREEHLRSYTVREILTRMLANLLNVYNGRDDQERSQRTVTMIEMLTPRQELST